MRNHNSGTKIAEWVGGFMVLFVVGVVVLALLPDSFWSSRQPEWGQTALTTVPTGVWPAAMIATPGEPTILPVAGARTVPAQPGLMPFEQAPKVKFNGRIQQITELQQRDGQIHIWVHDTTSGKEQQISVAPSWFLEYMGCMLTHDLTVSGLGFRFDNQGPDPLIYAQKIVVNGRNCRLRNDEGFALWSNRLR